MDTDILRRLHYAAAIACGVFAALVVHIVLTVFGVGLDTVLRDAAAGNKQQLASALAWWAIGGAGFVGGWATGAYLIAAARERDFVYQLARRFLIALVFAVATAGGVMSKSEQSRRHGGRDRGADRARLRPDLRLLRRAARLSQRRAGVARFGKNGAQGRNRTTDTAIFNRMLYQLSYLGARPSTCPLNGSGQQSAARYRGPPPGCPERPPTLKP